MPRYSDNLKEPQNPHEWVVWKAARDLSVEAKDIANKLWGDRPPFTHKLKPVEIWQQHNRIRYNKEALADIIRQRGPEEFVEYMQRMQTLDRRFGTPPPVTMEDMHGPQPDSPDAIPTGPGPNPQGQWNSQVLPAEVDGSTDGATY